MPQPEHQLFDFRSEIVPIEQIVPQINDTELSNIEVEVATNRHLKSDGRSMRIAPANFAFNALMLAQGRWASHLELSDLVAFPIDHKKMMTHVNQLNADLVALTGVSVAIQTRRKGTELERRFLPTLSFHDARGSAENRLLEMGIIGQDDEGQPIFEDVRSRRATLETLFKTYASDPLVLDALQPTLRSRDETELPTDRIAHTYNTVKAALQNYVFSKQKDEDLMRQATLGYYELFFNLYPRVKRIARQVSSAELCDDAVQQSSIALLKVLIDLSKESEGQSIDERVNYFYNYVTTSILRNIKQLVADETRIAECLQPQEAVLVRKVIQQIEELRQKNQSEPTTAQIVEALQKEGVGKDSTRSCLWRLQNPPVDFEVTIEKVSDSKAVSDNIENANEAELIEHILNEAKCSINQKAMISLYYDVWLPSLAGSAVMNRTEETFVYPASKEAFRALQADEAIEFHKDVGRVMGFQSSSVASGIDKAIKKVRSLQVA